jgi:hypothetical protein
MGIRNAKPTADREALDDYIQHVNRRRTPPIDTEAGGDGSRRRKAEIEVQRKQQANMRANGEIYRGMDSGHYGSFGTVLG